MMKAAPAPIPQPPKPEKAELVLYCAAQEMECTACEKVTYHIFNVQHGSFWRCRECSSETNTIARYTVGP